MKKLVLSAACLGALCLGACASVEGRSIGGTYVDPNTCEIKGGNSQAQTPTRYDPDCIKAAQNAAAEAARAAARKKAPPKK